jgi:hypothetical protein
MLNARLISRLTDFGLNIDPTGFETKRDKGSTRIKAGGISVNAAHKDFVESGINNIALITKNGSEIRNRLRSSFRASSLSLKTLLHR